MTWDRVLRVLCRSLVFGVGAGLFHWTWVGLEYAGLGMRRFGPAGLDASGHRVDSPYLAPVGVVAALALCVVFGAGIAIARPAAMKEPLMAAHAASVAVLFSGVSALWMALVYPEFHFLALPLRLAEFWDNTVVQRISVLTDIHWHRGFRRHMLAMSVVLGLVWILLDALCTAGLKRRRGGVRGRIDSPSHS